LSGGRTLVEVGKNLYAYPVGIEFSTRVDTDDITATDDDAREEVNNTIPIKRLDVKHYKNVDNGYFYNHFSLATILQAASSSPQYSPELLWPYDYRNYQGWVWKKSSSTYDVFVTRSTRQVTNSTVTFNLSDADSAFPDFELELPSGKDYGFARVHKPGSTWQIQSGYQVNLQKYDPPLDVSLSGTSSLCPGESGSWTASASGGASPYSYDWYYRKDSGTWYSQNETSSSFSRSMPTVNNSMDIKVTVTDDDNTQTSDTKLVYKEGGCDDDGGGGGGGGLLSVDPADSTKVGAKSLLQRQPIPDEFALDQNSPNPAHGTVTIRFALPEATEVSLVVYDIMGREVSRLVDGSVSAGFHDVQYDTSDLASGVYLYRIETPDFAKTQRMTIIR